jgi:hypothetical protein
MVFQFINTKIKFIHIVLVCVCGILLGSSSCKNPNGSDVTPTESKTTLLTKNSWVIERYTYANAEMLPESKLNSGATILKELIFQFRTNNQVRAIVKNNSQISNGGTWALSADEKRLTIDIPGLKDDFQLIEITKNKLVLRPNEKVFPLVDNNTVVNMVFIPTI